MSTKRRLVIKRLEDGAVWIEGPLTAPPEGINMPLVIGREWLLEMVRTETGRTHCLYWAPYAIVHEVPELNRNLKGLFVGFSAPSKPPLDWLVTSMIFDIGSAALPRTPQEFIALIGKPRPYVTMENKSMASPLSQKAKALIACCFTTSTRIEEIASELGVSHPHLTRRFKSDFGLTPLEYQHRLRVSEAISALSRGKAILDIGYDVGFTDTSRFYKNFRKITGTSPGKCSH